jgi:hypothetical protein
MTAEPDAQNETIPGTVFNPRQVRILKIVVIAMGILLLGGFAFVISAIVYQATRMGESESVASPTQTMGNQSGELRLDAPSGTRIEGVTLDGKRMAVHLIGPNGAEIAVIDVDKGRVIARIRLRLK